jgi:hypothetical protein
MLMVVNWSSILIRADFVGVLSLGRPKMALAIASRTCRLMVFSQLVVIWHGPGVLLRFFGHCDRTFSLLGCVKLVFWNAKSIHVHGDFGRWIFVFQLLVFAVLRASRVGTPNG